MPSYQICTGKVPDLQHLKSFGSRIYALPPRKNGKRDAKLENGTRVGIFLGYCKSLRNALYWDLKTKEVKTAQHVGFNETYAGEDFATIPPHAKILRAHDIGTLDPEDFTIPDQLLQLDVSTSPFTRFNEFVLPVDWDDEFPLGLEFSRCSRLHRAYVSSVDNCPSGHKLPSFRKHHLASYITSLDGQPIFSLDDIASVFSNLCKLRELPDELKITLAPPQYKKDIDDRPSPIHLRVNNLKHIHALNVVDGEGLTGQEYIHALHTIEDSADWENLSDSHDNDLHMNRLQTAPMTDEERALKKFTRRNLQHLSNWDLWDACFDKQLDANLADGTTGHPVL